MIILDTGLVQSLHKDSSQMLRSEKNPNKEDVDKIDMGTLPQSKLRMCSYFC